MSHDQSNMSGTLDAAAVDPMTKTDEEWRAELTPEQYKVLRQHGTERAFTSPLNDVKEAGIFSCAACGAPLFATADKFDSGTGWPSYTRPVDGGDVTEHQDKSWFMTRTEVRCGKCDGHLGHVFPDGPAPTGLRYCINGAALEFEAEEGSD